MFQEFSLVPSLTVEDNLFLGREMSAGGVLKAGRMRRAARKLIEELGFGLNPNKRVDDLSRAHQQMTEIAKALLGEVKLLILDEPTASLTERETGRLFELIAKLKSEGVGIIYVSHRMREIRALADRITVLRDGRLVKTLDAEGVADSELVELMTGRKIDVLFPKIHHAPGEVAVVFRDPRESPHLKLAKCRELGIEVFYDDREDVCRILAKHGILALRVPRREDTGDLEGERR